MGEQISPSGVTMDIERYVVDAATLYLLWQGNRIFAQQGPAVPPVDWQGKLQSAARYWPMAAMAILAVAIWIQPYFVPSWARPSISDAELAEEWKTYHYQEIWNRTFSNETVPLDGIAYNKCTFDNVTFVYKGTAPTRFDDCHFTRDISLRSPNPSIEMMVVLLTSIQKTMGTPPTITVEPPAPWEK